MTAFELTAYIRVLSAPRTRAVLDGIDPPQGADYWDIDTRKLRNLGGRLALPLGALWLPAVDDLLKLIELATMQKWPMTLARFATWINLRSGNASSVLAGSLHEALLLFYIDLVSGRVLEGEKRLLQ